MKPQPTTKTAADSRNARAGDVRSVARAISVLTAFEDAEELSLADLAASTRLPKPTVFRLVLTLENAGLLSRSQNGNLYSLGPRLVSISRLVLTRGLPETARPHLQALARTHGHTVSLAVLNDDEMLFVDVIESRSSLRMVSGIGTREPFHATAVGKAVVSELDPSQLDGLLSRRPLRAVTPNTITSRAQFEAELEEIRVRGYATDHAESQTGAHCVAAPIIGRDGVVGGISVSAAAAQLPEEDFPVLGRAVREAADAMSAALGSPGATA